jgi:hypothetical protein
MADAFGIDRVMGGGFRQDRPSSTIRHVNFSGDHHAATILHIVLCIHLSTSCASSGTNFNEARVADIRKGVTTETDLNAMFGEPGGSSLDADGNRQLTWMYSEHKTSGKSFIPVAGAFMGGGKSKHKMLFVGLNPEGTVETFSSSTNSSGSRGHTQDKPE